MRLLAFLLVLLPGPALAQGGGVPLTLARSVGPDGAPLATREPVPDGTRVRLYSTAGTQPVRLLEAGLGVGATETGVEGPEGVTRAVISPTAASGQVYFVVAETPAGETLVSVGSFGPSPTAAYEPVSSGIVLLAPLSGVADSGSVADALGLDAPPQTSTEAPDPTWPPWLALLIFGGTCASPIVWWIYLRVRRRRVDTRAYSGRAPLPYEPTTREAPVDADAPLAGGVSLATTSARLEAQAAQLSARVAALPPPPDPSAPRVSQAATFTPAEPGEVSALAGWAFPTSEEVGEAFVAWCRSRPEGLGQPRSFQAFLREESALDTATVEVAHRDLERPAPTFPLRFKRGEPYWIVHAGFDAYLLPRPTPDGFGELHPAAFDGAPLPSALTGCRPARLRQEGAVRVVAERGALR